MLLVIPSSSVDSPVKEMTATSSFSGLTTDSIKAIAAAFFLGQGSLLRDACVNEYRKAKREIDLFGERRNLLRLAVFENANVLGFQVQQQPMVLVLSGKKYIYGLGVDLDHAFFFSDSRRWCRRRL